VRDAPDWQTLQPALRLNIVSANLKVSIATDPAQTHAAPSSPTWLAYSTPVIAFLVLTWLESQYPGRYISIYFAKVAVVTAALVAFRSVWKDLRPNARIMAPAVLVGIAVFAEWVLVEKYVRYPHLETRSGFDPFKSIDDPNVRYLFLSARFFGLVAMVPLMEELFWRSFLIRFFTSQEWQKVPIGTFSLSAFAIVMGGFAMVHPEWLAAAICAIAYGILLRQTRSLFGCVIAHATTNLALGIYVIKTHSWALW